MDLNKVGTDRVQQDRVSEQSSAQKTQQAKAAEVKKNEDAKSAAVGGSQKSSVKWSPESQLLSEGLELAKSAPGASPERIAQLKAAIQNGTYKVDAQKVADRMIQNSLEEDLSARNG